MKEVLNKKTYSITAVIVATLLIISMTVLASAGDSIPSSKCAVAGNETTPIIGTGEGIWTNVEVLSTQIKTAEWKDLIISFTAEASLVTDTRIKGKGKEEVESTDLASIKVWATVDGVKAFPGEVTFAERIQTLKGKLSEWIIDTDENGNPYFVENAEELELILDTTEANGFNFIMADLGSGVHTVKIWATIELVDNSQEGVIESEYIAGAIGDRTLVVEEVRLVKDTF